MSRAELHLEIEDAAAGSLSSGSSTSPSFLASSLPSLTPNFDISVPQTIESSSEPEPPLESGPHYFHSRRARWLTPTEENGSGPKSRTNGKDGAARVKLERLVSESDITSDEAWADGISSVWNGLVNGGRLKRPLPLDIVIKVLKAGWHRDGTWPKGLIVPPSPPPLVPNELEPNVDEVATLPEPALLPAPTPAPTLAPAAVQERLIRIEGADDTGYLSDASRARLESALEKCDGNLDNLADEDMLRLKSDRMVVLETKSSAASGF